MQANIYYLNKKVANAWYKKIGNGVFYVVPSVMLASSPAVAFYLYYGLKLDFPSIWGSLSLSIPTLISTMSFISGRLAYSGVGEFFAKRWFIDFLNRRGQSGCLGGICAKLSTDLETSLATKLKRKEITGRLYHLVREYDSMRPVLSTVLGRYSPGSGFKNAPLALLSQLLHIAGENQASPVLSSKGWWAKILFAIPALPGEFAANMFSGAVLVSQIRSGFSAALGFSIPDLIIGALISAFNSTIRSVSLGQGIIDSWGTLKNVLKIGWLGSAIHAISLCVSPLLLGLLISAPKVFLAYNALKILPFFISAPTFLIYSLYEFLTNWQGYAASLVDSFINYKDGDLKSFLPGGVFSKTVTHVTIFALVTSISLSIAALSLCFALCCCFMSMMSSGTPENANTSERERERARQNENDTAAISGGFFGLFFAFLFGFPVIYYHVQHEMFDLDKSKMKKMKEYLEELNMQRFLAGLIDTLPIIDARGISFIHDTIKGSQAHTAVERTRVERLLGLVEANTKDYPMWGKLSAAFNHPVYSFFILLVSMGLVGTSLFSFANSLLLHGVINKYKAMSDFDVIHRLSFERSSSYAYSSIWSQQFIRAVNKAKLLVFNPFFIIKRNLPSIKSSFVHFANTKLKTITKSLSISKIKGIADYSSVFTFTNIASTLAFASTVFDLIELGIKNRNIMKISKASIYRIMFSAASIYATSNIIGSFPEGSYILLSLAAILQGYSVLANSFNLARHFCSIYRYFMDLKPVILFASSKTDEPDSSIGDRLEIIDTPSLQTLHFEGILSTEHDISYLSTVEIITIDPKRSVEKPIVNDNNSWISFGSVWNGMSFLASALTDFISEGLIEPQLDINN